MSDDSLESLFSTVDEGSQEEVNQEQETADQTSEEDPKTVDTSGDSSQNEQTSEDPGKEVTTTSEKPNDDEPWTKTAYLDEKRKRQDATARAEAAEARLAEMQKTSQAPTQEPEEVPDIFTDQGKYTDYVNKQVTQQVEDVRIEMSREFMRMQDSDYDAKEQEFVQLAKENPQLTNEVFKHAMPAKFIVETVNKARELKKLENVDEYKSKLKAEMKAELFAEWEAEAKAKAESDGKVSSIRPSLANARASSEQGESKDDDSLESLLG